MQINLIWCHSICKTKPNYFIFIRHHRPGAHPPSPSCHSHHTSSPAGSSNYRNFVPIMTSPSVHIESPHHITTHHQVSPVLSIVTSWIIVLKTLWIDHHFAIESSGVTTYQGHHFTTRHLVPPITEYFIIISSPAPASSNYYKRTSILDIAPCW